LAFIVNGEKLTWGYFTALVFMLTGSVFVVYDTMVRHHSHMHIHMIRHTHDGTTHMHIITHEHEHKHFAESEKHGHGHKDYMNSEEHRFAHGNMM
ncbi:MAG: EamA/RhaT family transporter, partial [Eubacteriales bacterium]